MFVFIEVKWSDDETDQNDSSSSGTEKTRRGKKRPKRSIVYKHNPKDGKSVWYFFIYFDTK